MCAVDLGEQCIVALREPARLEHHVEQRRPSATMIAWTSSTGQRCGRPRTGARGRRRGPTSVSRRPGLARTGAVEQPRVRPWATVLRIPTSAGAVWLKATGPEVAFEVRLYELLVRVAPERVLTPLATDAARGWLLLPDGGPSLADRGIDIAAALPVYARLQLDLAPHVEELLALGVADMRPAAMPARFDEALAAIGGDDRLAALRPAVAEWCERLAASPVPASIDHNDLHGVQHPGRRALLRLGRCRRRAPVREHARARVGRYRRGGPRAPAGRLPGAVRGIRAARGARRDARRSRAASPGSRARSCGSARSVRSVLSPSTSSGARRRASGCARCSEKQCLEADGP